MWFSEKYPSVFSKGQADRGKDNFNAFGGLLNMFAVEALIIVTVHPAFGGIQRFRVGRRTEPFIV